MKRLQHIILTVLLLASGCNKHSDSPVIQPENRPIEVGIASLTKAVFNDALPSGEGFVVWAQCVKPEGTSTDNAVFGTGGTKVYAPSWNYSPTRYWQKGTYSFAAVLPASVFNASYAATTETLTAPYGTQGTNSLALNFGTGGYNLATEQDDIMVAFANIDNTNSTMGTTIDGVLQKASLTFEHQFALVTIQAANLEPRTTIRIDEIKVYGNKSTVGDIVLTYNPESGIISSQYTLAGSTTKTDVYQTIQRPTQSGLSEANDWQLSPNTSTQPTYDTLIPDLLVFPETCNFTIEVKYTDLYNDREITTTKTGTLPATWEAGKKYNYSFTIELDGITFAEPTVQSWPTQSTSIDTELEM